MKWRNLILAGALAFAGCSSSSDAPPPAAPAAPNQQAFSTVVQDMFAATADDTEPVEINDIDLTDILAIAETAFDNLLN